MERPADSRRRSARYRRLVPLQLDWGGETSGAEAHVVSESGALVLVAQQLVPGLILELENRRSGETARARVVSCSREPDPFGCWQVGVALLSPRAGFFDATDADGRALDHERRRSRRVFLAHPVELVRDRETFAGRTRVVNRHGALVIATRSCPTGTSLWVRNLVSGRARPARVVRSGPAREGAGSGFDLAFEFEEPPRDFWAPDYASV